MLEHINTSLIDWSRRNSTDSHLSLDFCAAHIGAGSHHGYHGDHVLSYGGMSFGNAPPSFG